MKTLRYGIIGAGVIANLVARAFKEGRGAVATAVSDVDGAAARRLAEAVGAKSVHSDYRKLLEDPEVDAVYIATPPFLHRTMTLDALRAGKHVCCEKPFVLNRAEAAEIAAAAAAKPHLRVTSCSSRFHDSGTTRRARAMVAGGELGEVYRLHFEHVTSPPKAGSTLPAWRNDPTKNGGGISFDWGCYDLDWMSFVLGGLFRPRLVFGTLGGYFPLSAERVPPAPDVDGRLCAEIVCEGGLTLHWERRAGEHGPDRHSIEIRGRKAGINLVFVPMGDKQTLRHYAYEGAAALRETVHPDTPPNWDDTLVFPIRDLTAAVLEGRPPSNSPADNLRIHAILDALAESSRTGRSVTLPT
jgi:predicted dehydrogenase